MTKREYIRHLEDMVRKGYKIQLCNFYFQKKKKSSFGLRIIGAQCHGPYNERTCGYLVN